MRGTMAFNKFPARRVLRAPIARGRVPDSYVDPRRNDPTCPNRIMALIEDNDADNMDVRDDARWED